MNVKDRQCLLTYLKKADGTSYYTGEVDGIYGPLSKKAIQDFQEDFCGLTVTGEADAATDQAMIHAVAFGIPERDPDVTDNNVGNKSDKGTNAPTSFWDSIVGFDREEFRCTCGGRGCTGFPVEPHEQLVRNLADTRKHFGRIVPISSGVRCALRNSELPGSASNSLHMRGKAADFAVTGLHSSVTLAYIKTLPHVDEAYAIDDSFVHMGVLEYD